MGEAVKFPQLESWKNLLELFLFEKKAEGKLPALSTIIKLMSLLSLNAFLPLLTKWKSGSILLLPSVLRD